MKWLKDYYRRYKQARKWGVKVSEITFVELSPIDPEDLKGLPTIKPHKWYAAEEPPMNNPVAKFARKFNKATVQKDRKKADKRGYTKHKGRDPNG